jgi:biopolymer transport protein ExbD
MVPLINVVFLMLIFFLLVGTIRAKDPVALNSPESSHNRPHDSNSVLVAVDRNGDVWLDGTSITGDKLGTTLREILDAGEKSKSVQRRAVELRVDRDTTFGTLNRVLGQIEIAGANQTTLITKAR